MIFTALFRNKKELEAEPVEIPIETIPTMTWELVDHNGLLSHRVYRSQVPGGWIVKIVHFAVRNSASITFYPDAAHEWKI